MTELKKWQTPEYKARKREYDRQYRVKNADKIHARYIEQSERRKTPDFKRKKSYTAKKYYHGTWKQAAIENPQLYLWGIALKRARSHNIEFNISPDDIIIPEFCPITNEKLEPFTNKVRNSMSLDRIDSTKGYIKGNVAVLSRKGNLLKNNITLKQCRNMLKYMENYLE